MNARCASMASCGVDGFVAHRDADVLVAGDDLGDVRRQAVHDGVGDEDPSEVVGRVTQRTASAGSVSPVRASASIEQARGSGAGERAVLGADPALE